MNKLWNKYIDYIAVAVLIVVLFCIYCTIVFITNAKADERRATCIESYTAYAFSDGKTVEDNRGNKWTYAAPVGAVKITVNTQGTESVVDDVIVDCTFLYR